MNALPAVAQSRKLSGLVITLAALIVLAILGTVAIALWGVPTELFASIGGFIAMLGGGHQGAQMMADRSPNYTTQIVPPPSNVRVP